MTPANVRNISQRAAASTDTTELVDSLANRILSDLYGTDAMVLSIEDHLAHQRRRSFAAHPSNFELPDLAG